MQVSACKGRVLANLFAVICFYSSSCAEGLDWVVTVTSSWSMPLVLVCGLWGACHCYDSYWEHFIFIWNNFWEFKFIGWLLWKLTCITPHFLDEFQLLVMTKKKLQDLLSLCVGVLFMTVAFSFVLRRWILLMSFCCNKKYKRKVKCFPTFLLFSYAASVVKYLPEAMNYSHNMFPSEFQNLLALLWKSQWSLCAPSGNRLFSFFVQQ